MRLSIARAHTSGAGPTVDVSRQNRNDAAIVTHGLGWRHMTLLLALVLVVGSVGVLLGSAKPAGADTVFQTGQVFASVGNSTVNVYDPSSGNLLDSLVDNTDEPYTVDTAFNSQGDIFVADDVNGDISEFAPDGTPSHIRHGAVEPDLDGVRQPGEHVCRAADDAVYRGVRA